MGIIINKNLRGFSKEQEYLNYIDTHKLNVQKAFEKYGKLLCKNLSESIDIFDLELIIKEHDESKKSHNEFHGYRQWFYPRDGEKKDEAIFKNAWFHHLRNNSHHPEYWTYIDDDFRIQIIPMEPIDIAEMILDWASFEFAGKGSVYDFWIKNKDKKPLHPDTKIIVNKLINIIKE